MASQQVRTPAQEKLSNALQKDFGNMRAADPDHGKTYICTAMGISFNCLCVANYRDESMMTPEFMTYVFDAGQSALQMCGDRLLCLSGQPTPTNVAACAAFQPCEIREPEGFARQDAHEEVYRAGVRERARWNLNLLFAQPAESDIELKRLADGSGVLIECDICLMASKDMFADQANADELEWRRELLGYSVLTVVGLAPSLSATYGGRQVSVWAQIICGTEVADGNE